jgi:hypothetical protein
MAVIGLDFDGVICQLTESKPGEFLPPVSGALSAVHKMVRDGNDVVIYTARSDLKEVKQWLADHGFPKLLVTNEKIPADIYVDDKGYRFYDWDKEVIEDIIDLAGGKSAGLFGGKVVN